MTFEKEHVTQKPEVGAKLSNRRTLVTCALSNINKMGYFYAHAVRVLLFLVLAGNSIQFRILRSYTLLLKSPALDLSLPVPG